MTEECILIRKKIVEEALLRPAGLELRPAGLELSPVGLESLKGLIKGQQTVLIAEDNLGKKLNKAEAHKKMSDFFICLEGKVSFVYGGQLVNSWEKDGDENELRADKIQGGKEETLETGDMLFIPAGQPHQHNGSAYLLVIKIPKR